MKVHGIQDIQKMATVLEEKKREKKAVKSLLEEKIEKSFKEIIKEKAEEQDKTLSKIIVRPDGSRVLMITTLTGGMESNICIKLSEPGPGSMPDDAAASENVKLS